MAERLVILSDIWGAKKGLWITSYLGYLQQYFDIVYYDCQQLANIESRGNSAACLQQEFDNGGIATAATHLLRRESIPSHYLTFGVGGAIACNASLLGLPMKSLYAISSNEVFLQPTSFSCTAKLVYGQYDVNKPVGEWLRNEEVQCEVIPNFGQELYSDEKIIKKVCQELLGKVLQRQYQEY